LKNDAFSWTREATKDFEKLKEYVCTIFVFSTLDFTITFIVECDASCHGIGVVLMQEGRFIFLKVDILKERTYSNPFIERKCFPYDTRLRNDTLT
jgi:hypothetical protein